MLTSQHKNGDLSYIAVESVDSDQNFSKVGSTTFSSPNQEEIYDPSKRFATYDFENYNLIVPNLAAEIPQKTFTNESI